MWFLLFCRRSNAIFIFNMFVFVRYIGNRFARWVFHGWDSYAASSHSEGDGGGSRTIRRVPKQQSLSISVQRDPRNTTRRFTIDVHKTPRRIASILLYKKERFITQHNIHGAPGKIVNFHLYPSSIIGYETPSFHNAGSIPCELNAVRSWYNK